MSRWVNLAAVEWVLYEAPRLPSRLVSTLVAVASFVGEDGRAAYPSAATVAEMTRKSETQAKRDMTELEKIGLLASGDRRKVMHLRADRRPNVYDLPSEAREYVGRHRKRGASVRTPLRGSSRRTPLGSRGASGNEAGGMDMQHGVHSYAPEEIYEEISKSAPSAPDGGAADVAPETPSAADAGSIDVAATLDNLRANLAAKRGKVRTNPCE